MRHQGPAAHRRSGQAAHRRGSKVMNPITASWNTEPLDLRAALLKWKEHALSNAGFRPNPELALCSAQQWNYLLAQGYIKITGELTEAGLRLLGESISVCLN